MFSSVDFGVSGSPSPVNVSAPRTTSSSTGQNEAGKGFSVVVGDLVAGRVTYY
jgi:hypothetical protein